MTQNTALEITNQWHYEGIYSFYDTGADIKNYQEFISEVARVNQYFEVSLKAELVSYLRLSLMMR